MAHASGLPFLIHSPRWLRHVGRYDEAQLAWMRLGLDETEAKKEIESLEADESIKPSTSRAWHESIRELWSKEIRMRTFLGCFIMGMQQVSEQDCRLSLLLL